MTWANDMQQYDTNINNNNDDDDWGTVLSSMFVFRFYELLV